MNNNIKHITKLLGDHFNGDPWIDITILGELKKLSAKQAAYKPDGLNSVWEITNHMIAWRKALTRRVMNKPVKYSDDNFFREVKDRSTRAWKKTIEDFKKSQNDITAFLKKQDDTLLETVSPASGYTYYELVMAILLHDAYHTGQIVLLKKLMNI
jgi:uncharacterized damage-inducible protein DinB